MYKKLYCVIFPQDRFELKTLWLQRCLIEIQGGEGRRCSVEIGGIDAEYQRLVTLNSNSFPAKPYSVLALAIDRLELRSCCTGTYCSGMQ